MHSFFYSSISENVSLKEKPRRNCGKWREEVKHFSVWTITTAVPSSSSRTYTATTDYSAAVQQWSCVPRPRHSRRQRYDKKLSDRREMERISRIAYLACASQYHSLVIRISSKCLECKSLAMFVNWIRLLKEIFFEFPH